METWWENLKHFSAEILPHWGIWTVTVVLMLVGFLGTILPFLPGPVLIFVAGLWQTWLSDQGMSLMGLIVLAVLLIFSFVLDSLSGAVGAKWFGGSKWGIIGVLVGGVIGIFFAPIGIFVGPLLGAFLFEIMFAKKRLGPATKSTIGTAVGTTVGAVVKGVNSLVMIAWILFDIFRQ